LSVAKVLADPEDVLGFFDAVRVAEKLKGDSAIALFQNDSKKIEVVAL
jgi:hypothetical protein